MQPQVCNLYQGKLTCNMLQQAVALLIGKTLVFELASSNGNLIAIMFLLMFGFFWRW